MAPLTFKQFLNTVPMTEDIQQEIAKLTADIATIDTQIAQRTTPLQQRKLALQKQLAMMQKRAQATSGQQEQGMQAGQPPASNRTTTPGGTGTATPGTSPSLPR